jgi:hypothetical protein
MRRMLIPLAGLLLSSVVGCTSCVRGKCDCDFIPTLGCDVYHVKPIDLGVKGGGGCATCSGGQAAPVAAPEMVPVAPTPLRPEAIREMPRVVPNREEEQQQQQ